MTLRTRLFVTILAVALPLGAVLFLVGDHVRLVAMEDELRRSVESDITAGLQQRCESDPPREGRPGRGGGPPTPAPAPPAPEADSRRPPPRGPARRGDRPYEYFAYDAGGRPTAVDAPPLPAERGSVYSFTYWSATGRGVALVVPLDGAGPCAVILARVPPRPGELRDQVEALVLVVLSVLAAAWLAAGPIIARMRRLAAGMRRSAASYYEETAPTDGPREVSEVADAFNEAGRRVRAHLLDLQAREETLRAFVANTTHDVAIPLTVLQGHLAELDRLLEASAAHRAVVRQAVQEAHYMGSLLRNLGAATRLDDAHAQPAIAPVDLSALVERVVARHRPIARAARVELNAAVPDPPLVVATDPTLLEQAVSNLVDNAVRYNHADGHVAVLLDQLPDGFLLSVTDDGPGVAEADLAELTRRWYRGSEARTRRPDGKGLGLAIAAESLGRLGLELTFSRPVIGGLRAVIRPRAAGAR